MLARDCGVYANRNPAAHEVRDDEGSLWCAFGDFPRIGKVTPPAGAPRRGELREGKKKRFPFDRQKKIPPEASSGQISRAAHPRFPKEAADACLRSIAPPLQTKAEASAWETGEEGRKTLPICR